MDEIITFGELLIDFVPTVSGVSLIEAPAFKKAPGGAPANVAVGLARLGVPSAFIGKVGEDAFGHFLVQILEQAGVDVHAVCYSSQARTALAFVTLRADGEREFMFYRHPSADMLLTPQEVDLPAIQAARGFHYGSISLISEPSRDATFAAIQAARSAGKLVSYDPNLRLNLWADAETAKAGIRSAWNLAQVIKISEEELAFLHPGSTLIAPDLASIEPAARELWHPELELMVVTLGKLGCVYLTRKTAGLVEGFKVEAVDATGAGDGFVAGLLKGLYDHPHVWENEPALREVCHFANAVGALTTTERGAIPALPALTAVEQFLAGV